MNALDFGERLFTCEQDGCLLELLQADGLIERLRVRPAAEYVPRPAAKRPRR
jgi:hypothetical protein